MRRGAALVLGAAAVCSVLRGGFGIAPFRRSASDFHGSLKAITKVVCGAALRDYDATMHLVYMFGVCAVNYMSVFSVVLLTFPTTKPCQDIG